MVGNEGDGGDAREYAGRKPCHEVRERFDSNIRGVALLQTLKRSGCYFVRLTSSARDVFQYAKFIPEGFASRSVQGGGLQCAQGRPDGMKTEVLVEISCVIEGDAFETFKVGSEVLELGETSASFFLDMDLYFTEPSTLHLNSLTDHLLLEAMRR
jgi:hypothetical protein